MGSVYRQVFGAIRAFSAEFDVTRTVWVTTAPAIQNIMSNSPCRRLDNRSPITAHSVIESRNPLNVALRVIR